MVPPGDIGALPLWVGVFVLLGLALAVFNYAFYSRVVRLVLQGKETSLFDHPLQRLNGALLIALGQQKVLQRVKYGDYAGIGHAIIFWGFLTFMLSYGIFIFAGSAWRGFPEWLLTETGVRVYSSYLDILAAVLFAVLVWAFVRRWVLKPSRLRFDLTRHSDALVIVVLIGGLMLSTILTHAFWVAQGGTGPEADVFIGAALGGLFTDLGLGTGAANVLQGVFWWTHLSIILIFTVYIPYTKHMHMFAAPVNAFFRSLEPKGALPFIDLENTEKFGAGRVQDFTWKQLLDGYACAVCGRCTDVCPAHLTGKQLSPMHIVENLKDHMVAIGHQGERNPEHVEPTPILNGQDGVISEASIWDCLNCGACMEECPVTVEHVPTIMDMRRHLLLEESKAPESAMTALLSMEQRGHPWRGTQYSRTDWAEGLEVPTLAEKPDAEILFWVGCTPALEQRSQAIARSMAKVLKAAKVDFAILGDEETCTGDPARRMGNEYLFQILAAQNIETMTRYNVKKVVTICPHCFNTMKNEYPQLGGNFEVLHYSQFVDQLIKKGSIKPVKMMNVTMAYHDSCFLGRHNGIYDEPRDVAKAIPGLKLVEMGSHCRERGFCCGAGGGHMWIEESQGERVNHVRTDQFLETGAQTVGVSCPFCLQMMTEGIEAKGMASEKDAKDVLEILAESLDL
ncbi:MAG: 4Fe-4S dicluster domain-containing protein [Chloroflexi bacterium]|nr:4Fe-4S dicluster domain-containing protein [Chloroflexota bacterium]MCI0811140.1 4Fe-4S dicluster domain-containing protein [Chloroflexota bacterium]MCI0829474.1 4Fe-4S dicluster domain-containing protein [Chloroflexota bacterium]MCI0847107.1 4Fe-4S dicluster domain-containing protein [Chloroflexota bacterium]MCI0900306.1 4Fe-4S dicluster domain-containing protein [Chloroflexota bacterium]